MNKIGVLYIIDIFFKVAGSERNLIEVVSRLNHLRYTPMVMCLKGGRGGAVDLLKNKGIEVINLNLKRIYSPQGIIKAWGMFKFIRQRKIKIVVTYHESSDFLGGIVAKLAGVPVIISSRRDMGYKLKKRHIVIYRIINKVFDKILTVSDAVKDMIFDKQNVLWHKLITVHNGVELDKFSKIVDKNNLKKSLGIELNKPVVGMLATLRPIKGHRYFLEAASTVLRKFPEVYFLVVGWPENSSYYEELKMFVKRLGIRNNVIFTGGRSDTSDILSIMDISVLSSINEGFPNVALESMAMGRPVVATNSGGTPEAVVHGQTGILVPPRDAGALADAILKLLNDKKMVEDMGKAGRERAESIFSIERMIEAIEKLYAQLIVEKHNHNKSFLLNVEMLKIMFFRIIKISFSNIVYCCGIRSLINKIFSRNKIISIITYHKINNYDYGCLNLNIKVDHFEKHMRYIKEKCNPISLEQAFEIIKNKKNVPDNAVVVTFDDGYKDNYTNAFPILKKYKIPATIFLTVDAVNKQQALWFDKVINALKETKKDRIEINKILISKLDIFNLKDNRLININDVINLIKGLAIKEREDIIRSIIKELGVNPKVIDSTNDMLNWEEIKEMQKDGVGFGSHGMSHSILTKLSNEESEYEIRNSKHIIEENTGVEVKSFAYPNGGVGDFNSDTTNILKKCGYAGACTLVGGSNNGTSDLFALKRYCVNKGMESNLFGVFSKALFATETLGVFEYLRRIYKKGGKNEKMCKVHNAGDR